MISEESALCAQFGFSHDAYRDRSSSGSCAGSEEGVEAELAEFACLTEGSAEPAAPVAQCSPAV